MILDLILGVNLDTPEWINDLKETGVDYLAVLDYDLKVDYKVIEGITYMSVEYVTKNIKKYDSVNFYKSLYVYPGMSGSMSSLQSHD